MADSPGINSDRILSYTLYSDGNNVGDGFSLSYADVRFGLNRIGRAVFKFDAGDMPGGKFEETDSDLFKPGALIRFDAGDVDNEETLFVGKVVGLGIEIGGDSRAQMVVECRDSFFAAAGSRKNRVFEEKTDAEVIAEVLGSYGQVKVDDTACTYPALVQYYCTDWDFALARADAGGLVVNAVNGEAAVVKPEVGGTPVLTVTYGVDLVDFEGEVSAAEQFSKVEAVSWNPKEQALVSVTAAAPGLNEQGNIAAGGLAVHDSLLFQHDAPVEGKALQAWVDGQAQKTGLARFRGSFSFVGNAAVKPGCIIELAGLGDRFNGNVYVGGVEHVIRNNVWITRAEMGISPANAAERPEVCGPRASGWLPGIGGLHTGKVKKLDGDPLKEYRIQVEIPLLQGSTDTVWARFAAGYAGNGTGVFVLPEAGDEVVVGFVNDDPGHPVILGSLYSSKQAPPYEPEAENNCKALVTREKMKVEFDEEKKVITVSTPGDNLIELSDEGKSIRLADQNGNSVLMDDKGITLESAGKIILKAKGDISAEATGKVAVAAKSDVSLEGMNVKATAKTGFTAKGNATAELSASGQTTVKGGMVMIN